jgi:hypothetical protein
MAMCPQEDQNKERPSERQHWPSSLHSVYFNSLLTFRFLSSSQYSLRIFNTNPTYDLFVYFLFPQQTRSRRFPAPSTKVRQSLFISQEDIEADLVVASLPSSRQTRS